MAYESRVVESSKYDQCYKFTFEVLDKINEIMRLAAAEPGSKAAREDALNGAPVKCSEGFCRHAKLLESPQKVKVLLGSFYSQVRLPGPGEIIFDEHTEESSSR